MSELSTCEKSVQRIEWNKTKSKFMVFKRTKTFNYDPILQHRLGHNAIASKTEWLELSSLGEEEPKKSVIIQIILKKTALNPENLEMLSIYQSQMLSVKVLSDSRYKYQFLTVCENRVFIHNLSSGQTVGLSLSGEQQGIEKQFLGTPKKLSNSEALEFIESGCPIYEKQGDSFRILV